MHKKDNSKLLHQILKTGFLRRNHQNINVLSRNIHEHPECDVLTQTLVE